MTEKSLKELLKRRKKATRMIEQGHHQQAVVFLKESYRKFKDNPVFLTDLISTYVKLFDYEKVKEQTELLLKKFGTDAQVILFAADTYAHIRQPELAKNTYKKLSSPSGNLKIAGINERQGKLDESEELIDTLLKKSPNSEDVQFLNATLLTRRNKLDNAEEALFNMLSKGIENREIQWKTGHLLANVLDKQGNYSDAIQVLTATKQGMQNDYHKEISEARKAFALKCEAINNLNNTLSTKDILQWRNEIQERDFPVALLGGHPRSGTTLLERILDQHNNIVSVEETSCLEDQTFRAVYGIPMAKPELFNLGFLNNRTPREILKAQRIYLDALKQSSISKTADKLLIDKNPMLTHVIGLIQRFYPAMKSIIAIRDPRAVCLSCFQQSVGVNTSNVSWLTFEDTVKAYNAIMSAWIHLREILPDGWIEIRYEDLVQETESSAKKVIEFLELEWTNDLIDNNKSSRITYSPTYAQVSKPIYRSALSNWENYDELLAPHLKSLAPVMHSLGY